MSEFNITVEGGKSVRLPTAGKYCDRDIVVTATVDSEQPKKILRYIKFVVNEVRGGGTQMQFSEIDFLDADGNRYNWPTTTVVSSPDMPATASVEGQDKIIDGLTSTKFCTVKFASGKYLLIDLGEGNGVDVREYGYWQWWTANDNAARDPISFELWGSENGDTYELLDSADKTAVPTTRQAVAYANWVHISEEVPDADRYNQGYADGLTEGYESGKADGITEGKAEGQEIGYADALAKRTDIEITENGEYTPSGDSTGFKSVIVNVDASGGGGFKEDYLASRMNNTLKTYISDEVLTIPNYAFYGCTSIESVRCQSCTYISTAPFQNCKSLKVADFPLCEKIGGTVFRGCSSLTDVNLPLITETSTYSFAECSSLESISLPKIKTVAGAAFQSCSALEYAYIPNATSIGAMCFQYCSVLSTVIIEQDKIVCSLAAVTAFGGTPIEHGNGFIYVPDNLVDSYKATTNWAAYADQIKPLSELEV